MFPNLDSPRSDQASGPRGMARERLPRTPVSMKRVPVTRDLRMAETGTGDKRGPASAESEDVRAAVFRSAVAHLFEQSYLASTVNISLAALVTWSLWGSAPTPWLLAWAAALFSVNVARIGLAFVYWRTALPPVRTWYARFVAGMMASSGLWGLAGALFMPIIPPMEALALALAIGGVAAGGLPLLGAIQPLYLTHVALALVPVVITFVVLASHMHTVLAIMVTLYAGALVMSGRTYSRNLHNAHLSGARLDEANRSLEWRASHDTLTGLWNRQRFENELDEELERAQRYNTPCSLIMLDVDHFKSINDAHGHDAGDRVLARLGRVLAEQVRGFDQVARWGGEEFMVLLPQTELAAATQTAERLRARIAQAGGGDNTIHCTASLGVASCNGPEQRSAVMKRLDDALYRAKEDGRNRVYTLAEAEWRAPRALSAE